MLTPKSIKQFQVGSISVPEREGESLVADILITDEHAIRDAERGKTGLSCGYRSRVFDAPGVWKDADGNEHKFDAIQTEIRGNHVAQCWAGRAGNDVCFRMDEADAVIDGHPLPSPQPEPPKQDPKGTTMKIKIGDIEFDVPDAVGAAWQKQCEQLGTLTAEVAALKAAPSKTEERTDEIGKLQRQIAEQAGRLAAAEAELKERRDSKDKASAKEAEANELEEKLKIRLLAAPILKKPMHELVRMDERDIVREVVKIESPKISLEGQSDEFALGIFKHVTSNRVDTAAALNTLVGDAKQAPRFDEGDAEAKLDAALKRAAEKQANRWKEENAKWYKWRTPLSDPRATRGSAGVSTTPIMRWR
jgi:hypothetical protein